MSVPNATAALLQLAFNLNGNIVNPDTGEIAALAEADLADLVAARAALTDLDTRRKNAVAMLDDELVKRTDEAVRAGRLDQHTYTVGDYKVQVDASTPTRVNGNGLRTDLMRKALAGELSIEPDAVAHMFRTSYTLDKNRWKTQTKLDPALEQIYDQHATPTRRTTTVTRYRPAAINTTSTDDPLLLEEPPPMVTTDLITVEPLLPMSVEAAEGAMDAYQELTRRLLTKDDWQGPPGQQGSFVKRRGWAKLATFYGVSTELLRETIDRDDDGQVIRARVIARATHPNNGRYADGDGACSITEARFASKGGRVKVEHDLPATAATRATNRAISNLIGFGAVSAEEVDAGPAPDVEPVPLELLTPEARFDVITALQKQWPGINAHPFLPILADKLGLPEVPHICGRALAGWAWWQTQPQAQGNVRADDDAAVKHAAWAQQQQTVDDAVADDTSPLDLEPAP